MTSWANVESYHKLGSHIPESMQEILANVFKILDKTTVENTVRHSFHLVSGKFPKTMRKLCPS